MTLRIEDIETERLLLTALSYDHSEAMFRLWSHPDVCRYSGTVTDYDRNEIPMPAASREDSDKIIDFWQRATADGWGFRWAILECSTAQMLGHIGFNSLGPTSELAYHLHPDHWGKGIMSEAAAAAIGWALTTKPGTKLEAFIEPANTGSVRLAQRLHFSPTGHFSDGAERYERAPSIPI
ncbi:MAG: GNAT family N-acetyltransferase [Rhodobiaceae bacterium]|nr:GNAT family N-acetyltransferase [Rhodobiaceae bacterium]